AESKRASPNYDWRGQVIANNYLDYVYGDKNIYTTPRDLLIWHRALSSNLLFKAETLQAAYQPYSNERPGIKNYGLGWRMNIYPNGKKVIFHNGWWHGNNASFIRLLDEDITIIVLGNRYNRGIYKVYKLINSFSNYFEVLEEEE
ncbi:MAG TPA: serine hydrolase domain-containing protein, partial [Ferruginibacter sp.]|nr:serine hydrolase domain-containing protein [Ferruginibacter sp.]